MKLDPSTGIRLVVEAHRADMAGAGADRARHGVLPGGRRGCDALRGAPARGDGRRQHALHPAGRRRGDVAHHAAAARRPAAGAPVRAGLVGARRKQTSWSPATAAGTSPGSRHERRHEAGRGAAAERGGAVAVHADRGLRVPVELPHRRARRARRGDRLALRAVVRLAERVRQPARPRGRAPSGSARSGSTTPRRASTSRARTCSRRRGRRRPAGSSSATR